MYEKNERINWVKIFVRVLTVFVILLLSIKLISILINKNDNKKSNDTIMENLKVVDDSGKKYIENTELNIEVGKNEQISLSKLKEQNFIEDVKDANGTSCDMDNSYIKITRLEHEYQITSYLVCGNNNDYYNSFVKINDEDIIKETTTKKKVETTKKIVQTTKKKTTKKVRYYSISFNSNGGSEVNTIKVKENGKVNNLSVPVRAGYKFLGWYYHGVPFNTTTNINSDYVLTAKWVKE